jgi:NAD(P)-dependent dehydrogenase (short-subunit alcohol dehydrogenase family)
MLLEGKNAIVYGGGGAMGGAIASGSTRMTQQLSRPTWPPWRSSLSGEVGKYGVRVVSLRPNFTPETSPEPVDLESDALRA